MRSNFPNLFQPLKVKNLVLKNRIMSAPNMLFHTVDGRPTDYYVGYLEHKARGGAGIVNLGEVSVGDGGNHTPEMIKTFDNLPMFAELSAAIHEHGAIASAELTHGGIRVKSEYNHRQAAGPVVAETMSPGVYSQAMTPEMMEDVCQQYADTALYVLRAGFDTVLLHFGHGWLPAQFLSPITNTREDEYGGSIENRMRFPLQILKTVREHLGPKQAIMMRVSGSERQEDGFTVDDIICFIEKAQEYVDLVEVSCEDMVYNMAATYQPLAINAEFAEAIKKSGRVHIPIFSVGSIIYPELAEEIISSGKADGVSMSRALIADPYLPEKAFLGRENEITPCLRCMGCTDGDNANRHMVCSVNPLIGREARLGFGEDLGIAKFRKKVLVIGGGPAGIQAAVTAKKRGHDVTLWEKTERLGGLLNFTDIDSLKHDLRRYKNFIVDWAQNSGITIELNKEATMENVNSFNPDDIIIATGSSPIKPIFLNGYEYAKHAIAVYNEPLPKGKNIIMIGGGLIGVETSLHLCNLGKNVTVLESEGDYARDAGFSYKCGVNFAIKKYGLSIQLNARVIEIKRGSVVYEKDGKIMEVPCDAVYYAVGMKSNTDLYFELAHLGIRLAIVGDCKKVGKVAGAVHSGFFAATDIGKM